jgi:hypothetical protein
MAGSRHDLKASIYLMIWSTCQLTPQNAGHSLGTSPVAAGCLRAPLRLIVWPLNRPLLLLRRCTTPCCCCPTLHATPTSRCWSCCCCLRSSLCRRLGARTQPPHIIGSSVARKARLWRTSRPYEAQRRPAGLWRFRIYCCWHRGCMLLLYASRLAVCDLPQPITAVEEVQVLLRTGKALLLAHGGAGGASGTEQHCHTI